MKSIILVIIAALGIGCAGQPSAKSRMRRMKSDAAYYHRALEMHVGWLPYSEEEVVATGNSKWAASKETGKKGLVPVIIVSYPDTTYSLSLKMDIDNALLGKLVKHSLMTQKAITWPLEEYLAEADCAQCHPAHIKLPPDP